MSGIFSLPEVSGDEKDVSQRFQTSHMQSFPIFRTNQGKTMTADGWSFG